MPDASQVIITAIVVGAAILVGFATIDQINVATEAHNPSVAEDVTRKDVLLQGAGQKVTVGDGFGTDETVYKTTGYAVNLTGADDSFVQSDGNVDFATDDNWTVSVWARVDSQSADANMSALSLNGRVVVFYNGTAGNWSAWYYDDGATNSYQVNVSDNGEQPGNFTNIIVRSNATTLSIYRNGTPGDSKNVTTESIVDAPVDSTNWDGRLEEVRTFDQALDATNRSEIVNSPVEQQPDLDKTSRIMFDQPDRSTQVLLFTSADLTQSNVSYSSGFSEQIMQGRNLGNDLLMQTDYIWYETEPAIEPVAGRELDGAPVVYVSYSDDDSQEDIKDQITDALVFAGLIPLVLIVVMVLRTLRDL